MHTFKSAFTGPGGSGWCLTVESILLVPAPLRQLRQFWSDSGFQSPLKKTVTICTYHGNYPLSSKTQQVFPLFAIPADKYQAPGWICSFLHFVLSWSRHIILFKDQYDFTDVVVLLCWQPRTIAALVSTLDA